MTAPVLTLSSMPDETVAGTTHGGGAPTEKLTLEYPPTGSTPGEAWSAEEPETEMWRESWRSAWGVAGVVLAVACVVAFVVGVVGWALFVNTRGQVPKLDPGATTPTLMAPTLPPIPTPSPVVKPKPTLDPLDGGAWVAAALSPHAISTHLSDREANLGGVGAEPTQAEATKVALRQCAIGTGNNDCELLNEGVYHGCVAFMIDPVTGAWAAGIGNTLQAALDAASKALGAHTQPFGDGKCGTHAGEQ